VTPEEYNFGNIFLGGTPAEKEFTICNTSSEDSIGVLTVTEILPASGEW